MISSPRQELRLASRKREHDQVGMITCLSNILSPVSGNNVFKSLPLGMTQKLSATVDISGTFSVRLACMGLSSIIYPLVMVERVVPVGVVLHLNRHAAEICTACTVSSIVLS